MKAKRRVLDFNFGGEGNHVALVDKAANETTVLTMKAAEQEVQVTTSMKEFLTTFMDMWSYDAEVLARILGYSGDEWYDDDPWIEDAVGSVKLLKGYEGDIQKLPSSTFDTLKSLEAEYGQTILNPQGLESKVDNISNPSKGENIQMSNVEIDKSELAELRKAFEEAEAIKVELAKAKEVVEAMEKAKEEEQLARNIEVVKSCTFIAEDDYEVIAKALIATSKVDELGAVAVLKALTSAGELVKEEVTIEKGVGEDEAQNLSSNKIYEDAVAKALQERKAK